RLAATAICHRYERWLQWFELTQRSNQRRVLRLVLRREELEREAAACCQQVDDLRHRTSVVGYGRCYLFRFVAASTQLWSSMARVMSPTPPMRGVIQLATSATSSATSEMMRLPSNVVPAPTTTAPGRTMSAVMRCGLPAAATRMSACRV